MPSSSVRLLDLVPREMLDQLRRHFQHLLGVPLVFTDADGTPVTPVDQPLCFCASLLSPETPGVVCLRRRKWDEPEPELERELREQHGNGRGVGHRCRGGFRDTAAPIDLNGQRLGYVIFGRTLLEEPDLERFRQLALEGGMAADVGESVARCALVMSRERIEELAAFLRLITEFIASAAWERLQAQRVLELEKLRDDLIHMIVHDLRTPLTSVIGGLQTVIDTEFDTELTQEFVPMSLASANTLLEMVNTLLDVNKLESGQMTLDLGPVNVAETVQTAVDQVRGLALEHHHDLTTAATGDCAVVEADGDKIRRVLINLIGNAVKFTPDGGQITVSSHCDKDGLTLSVTDTGPGIAPEDRERIFEKFGQAGGAKKRNSTGLGLTFCKLVAEAHGGRIWVESEVGRGSVFSVFLPAKCEGPPSGAVES